MKLNRGKAAAAIARYDSDVAALTIEDEHLHTRLAEAEDRLLDALEKCVE